MYDKWLKLKNKNIQFLKNKACSERRIQLLKLEHYMVHSQKENVTQKPHQEQSKLVEEPYV